MAEILDETGGTILDELGNPILDESAEGGVAVTLVNVVHDAALATEKTRVVTFHAVNQYRVVQAPQAKKILVVHTGHDVEAMVVI